MPRHATASVAPTVGAAGFVIGATSSVLVKLGNPGNMGVCAASFIRDTVGFFAGSSANMGAYAYIRPEIIGLILGGTIAALAKREFRPRGGASPALRFALGFIFMASALVFLGCTVRAWIRLGGGDLNALFGIGGLVAGIALGTAFLKSGFNLGAVSDASPVRGWGAPAIAALLLVVAVLVVVGGPLMGFLRTPGGIVPAGLRAPLLVSLGAGLMLGGVAQRGRFCSVGGIRDAILIRRNDYLFALLGLVVGSALGNLLLGQFHLGFAGQPVAHTNALGNFAAMGVAGWAAVLLGGCPFRQVIMAAEGDFDAFSAVLGMALGALVAHAAGIVSTSEGVQPAAWPALVIMLAALIGISVRKRERVGEPAQGRLALDRR